IPLPRLPLLPTGRPVPALPRQSWFHPASVPPAAPRTLVSAEHRGCIRCPLPASSPQAAKRKNVGICIFSSNRHPFLLKSLVSCIFCPKGGVPYCFLISIIKDFCHKMQSAGQNKIEFFFQGGLSCVKSIAPYKRANHASLLIGAETQP